ncbi:glycosyltransferase [Piscinibacter sp. XHJ-5]|uniref:glycosyltransferase n=1 Tax=Piscinibacter sp. XHJ-5 TaxID=3037797 RepID=UPI0024532045|nr:glycosyltransferase [Piscinibacter sp. XHJ-5]
MPHLVVFSHLRWNFVYQRPQHLLSRLARHYPVLYIEEPLHDLGPPRLEGASLAPGVEVIKPRLTMAGPGGFRDDQMATLQPMIAEALRARGIDDCIAWFYTPAALPLLAGLRPRAVVYDCIDEPHDAAGPRVHQLEQELLAGSQLVLAAGPSLFEARRALHPNVVCVPSAVDAQHYSPQIATSKIDLMLKAEQVQGRIPGPRLGFFGVIDERVDMQLLERIADAQPDWQLVMVGPVARLDPAALPQRRNIHWLGPQPYQLLPQLVADWDVCLLPYALNDATRFISPTKTLEYMAAEKPIVSTPLHDVVAMYGDVVRIGRDAISFIEACHWALSETAYKRAERVGEMLSTVSRFSWDNTAEVVHEAVEKVLAERAAPIVVPLLAARRPRAATQEHEHAMAAGRSGRRERATG